MTETGLWRFDVRLFAGGPGIGIDEAGRGPLAGPVVACAVLFPGGPAALPGLRDGKTLTHARRLELFRLARRLGVRYELGWCSVQEIDRINILQASLLAMRRAVERLSGPPGALLAIDGPHVIRDLPLPQKAVIGGDSKSWSVALAGVIAKVVRDRWMDRFDRRHPGYGWAENRGYATAEHRDALKRLGPTPLHRRSFRPVAEALA